VESTADDWIVLRDVPAGRIKVFMDGTRLVKTAADDPCRSL
jgi:hypothetical protein